MCDHQADFMCGLMSDLHLFIKSMVIHGTEYPDWDQVSLNNTKPNQPIYLGWFQKIFELISDVIAFHQIDAYRAGPSCYLLLYDLTVCTNGIVTIINVFETIGSKS